LYSGVYQPDRCNSQTLMGERRKEALGRGGGKKRRRQDGDLGEPDLHKLSCLASGIRPRLIDSLPGKQRMRPTSLFRTILILLFAAFLVPRFGTGQGTPVRPGTRSVMEAHNCYPHLTPWSIRT